MYSSFVSRPVPSPHSALRSPHSDLRTPIPDLRSPFSDIPYMVSLTQYKVTTRNTTLPYSVGPPTLLRSLLVVIVSLGSYDTFTRSLLSFLATLWSLYYLVQGLNISI